MPRRSGPASRPAPSRPSAGPPQRPAGYVPAQQQTRPTSTSARAAPGPQQQHHAPPPNQAQAHPQQQHQQQQQQQAGSQPGLFSQMASTAAGVAVGSSIGHAVGSLFTGGGSEKPQEASPQAQQQQYDSQPQSLYSDAQPMDAGLYSSSASHEDSVCANDVRAFRKCMDDEKGNLSICGWYLDQLKACQSAARQY